MRPARIIATVVFVAALVVTGCSSRTADQTAAPVSSAPSSVTTTHSTAVSTTHLTAASTATTTSTVAILAKATCAVAPRTGPAGSRVALTCRGFAPSEQVDVTFGAAVLTTTKATTSGDLASSFAVPSGFAGSHYPGRRDTFQAKGRQSGKVASATFTVTG
jgi:large repetitive protein